MTQKVTVEKRALHKALQKLIKVVPNKSSLACLSYVHLSMDKKNLVLRATDLDKTLVVKVEAQGCIEACVLAKPLLALSKPESKSDVSDVVIERIDADRIGVEVDSMTTVLKSIIALEDFPELPKPKGRFKTVVKSWVGGELKKLLKYVLPAVSSDETRPAINCVALIDRKVVATDGHRLHTAVLPGAVNVEDGLKIPASAAKLCHSFLGNGDPVSIKHKDDKILIKSADWELYIKAQEASFPDFNQVIPKGHEKELEVETEVLSKLLKKLNGLSDNVKLSLQDGKCKFLTSNPEYGDTETELLVKQKGDGGEPLEIGFRIEYLLDAIDFDFDTFTFKFGGAIDPIIIQTAACRQSIVMPMRI